MRLIALTLFLAPLLLAGCAPADQLSAPHAPAAAHPAFARIRLGAEAEQALLERTASGLLYTSESDYPFTYFTHAGFGPIDHAHSLEDTEAPSAEEFRGLLQIPTDQPVESISLDDFFARHIERVDPADSVAVALVPRYVALRETLRRTLANTRVFRVGRIVIQCYIVGTDLEDNLTGLTTVSIET